MSTPHNSAAPGDFAKTVLMPGDPLRAQFIAENFLNDCRLVNNVRGIQGYTGTYKGVPVSVMASGMGMPSMGIYSYELFNFYGVENILRVGSVGALSEKLHVRDIVLAQGACTNSAYAAQFGCRGAIAPIADYGLLRTAADIENAFAKAQEREDLQIIFSVCEARRNPWFNMFKIVGDHAEMVIESQFTGRQQAPEVYDVNASIYVIRRAFLVDNPDPILWHSKFGVSVMMDTGIIDIDSEHDYLLMEAIAQHLYAHYPEFNAVRENIRG